jgi:peroxiredoxin
MQALASPAPDFSLPDVTKTGNTVSLADFAGKPILLMFICNHCPYVVHIIKKLSQLANQAQHQGYAVAAINANDVEAYPQDRPELMRVFAQQHDFNFPYLYDASQAVAISYGAACTPDFFVYDKNHRLQYRGQMDNSRPNNDKAVSGDELQSALNAIALGRTVNEQQTPSVGCNIKWRAGNEPEYY